ncbi:MAG: patatin-like phospholipase family protein [Candidatus Omnitrophica bacterium]|nr:patatin-like phospholipase family protein [Candidatus Omnitrophota bacterium]
MLNKDLIIQEIPFFAGLSREELQLVKKKANIVEYKKDQIIYAEGSPASFLYCVILGRIVIYTASPSGNKTILEYLHRGKYFGIISLLTAEPHSVTAQAINDSLLLEITKEDFDFILKKIPRLAIDLSQTLSRRLKNKDIHQKTIFESAVISIFSSYSQAGKTVYALNLALSLKKETHKQLIILDIVPEDKIHSMPQRLEVDSGVKVFSLKSPLEKNIKLLPEFILKTRFGIDLVCFSYNPEDAACVERLIAILSRLVNDYHYIILDLPSVMDRSILSILHQSDLIQILTSPDAVDLKKTRHLIEKLQTDFNFSESKIKIIINEYKLSRLGPQEERQLLNHSIFATLPKIDFGASDRLVLDDPLCEYALAVRRIARQLGDCLVGLALGVGVGYGFCHIGVLKVIEEEKIPIDVIAGSSIGALIASLWATGRSADEILEITKEFKEPKYAMRLIDLTIPFLGFIKGNKLYRFLKEHLGNKTFYDVRLPLKIVASDIRKKEPRVLDKGLLVDAIMTTCSMPGVFMPFKGQTVLDGGVINPLPTEVLFKMGVKKIIAVNVTPSREDMLRQYSQIKEEIALTREAIKKRRWFDLKAYFQHKFKNNILDIIFTSIEAMQSEMIEREAKLADIVLHPDTQGIHWLELHKAEEFARRGEEETRKNLDKIWKVINE